MQNNILENLFEIRKDAQNLSDASLASALVSESGDGSTVLMVKNVLAAEAVSRGLSADDPAIAFPTVILACGEADHGVIRFLPEAMREKAMGAVMGGKPLPLEVLVANHGFEMRLKPFDTSEMPSITNRIRRVIQRVLGDAPVAPASDDESVAKEKTFVVPENVRVEAIRARDWMRSNENNAVVSMAGALRATQLASGNEIGLETLEKMYEFFSSHSPDGDDSERVEWDLWGGNEAADWLGKSYHGNAMSDSEYDSTPLFNERQNAMYAAYKTIDGLLGPWHTHSGADGAHYMEQSPFMDSGMICGNCIAYKSAGGCELLNERVNAMGLCKLWIIPESLIGENVKKANPNHGKDGRFSSGPGGASAGVDAKIDRLVARKRVNVEPDEVGPIFSRMAKREEHPDVTELRVNGTMLLGGEGLGYARSEMPQIPPDRRDDFMAHLKKTKGVGTKSESVDPLTLRPAQKEISGRTSGFLFEKFRDGGISDDSRIIISRDNYVIDGHHTWGASVAIALDGGSKRIPVYRIDENVQTVLRDAHDFADSIGSGRLDISAEPLRKSGALWYEWEMENVEKFNPNHGKDGRFTSGGALGQTALGDVGAHFVLRPGKKPAARLNITKAIPGATGGFKAGIPTTISKDDSPVGDELTPNHSLWHHLEKNPKYSGKPGESKYRITAERSKLHKKIVDDTVYNVPTARKDSKGNRNLAFVMLGGGPAAGKSTGLRNGAFPGVRDKTKAVHINADDIKGELGEFELRFSENQAEHQAAAGFVHEESSYISKIMQTKAFSTKRHVVLDGTGNSAFASLKKKVDQARESGYGVTAAYSTIKTNEAVKRSVARSKGPERRFVPLDILRDTHKSVSLTLPEAMEKDLFDSVTLVDTTYRNNTRLIATRKKGGPSIISDEKLWSEFTAKGFEE